MAVAVMEAPRSTKVMSVAQKVVKKLPHREKMADMPTRRVKAAVARPAEYRMNIALEAA